MSRLLSLFAILTKTRDQGTDASRLRAVTALHDVRLVRWQLGGKCKHSDSYGAAEHPQRGGGAMRPRAPASSLSACQNLPRLPLRKGAGRSP